MEKFGSGMEKKFGFGDKHPGSATLIRIRRALCIPTAEIRVTSVADPDPGSGAFLTPGSGIGFFRIPDQTHIFESLVTIYWVENLYNSLKIA
jgi:hypothetical protein